MELNFVYPVPSPTGLEPHSHVVHMYLLAIVKFHLSLGAAVQRMQIQINENQQAQQQADEADNIAIQKNLCDSAWVEKRLKLPLR